MMSDRERWIVYPLLALAIALGAKGRWDAWRGTSKYNVISCRTLLIENELNEPQAVIQQNEQGAAELNLAGAEGLVEASLTVDEAGGRLVLVRRSDRKALVLGHDHLREMSGLWAIDRYSADATVIPLAENAQQGDAWQLLAWPTAPAEEDETTPEAKPQNDAKKAE